MPPNKLSGRLGARPFDVQLSSSEEACVSLCNSPQHQLRQLFQATKPNTKVPQQPSMALRELGFCELVAGFGG